MRWQRVNDRAVFLRHPLNGGHEFEVLALRVVDQRHGGVGNGSQRRNFTGMVHAQLDHRDFVLAAQTQHRERHADVVVQVTLRG